MRFRKIYNYSVLGAAGGLLAAVLHRLFFYQTLSGSLSPNERLLQTSLLGFVIGACIAFFPSFSESRARYDVATACRSALKGALLGGIGGLLLGPIEAMYRLGSGGLLARALGLGLLGLSVGAGEAFNGTARWWRGILGGLVGGVVAGLIVEIILPAETTQVRSDATILVLIVMGIFISLFIAVFVHVLSESWLEGLPGSKVEGSVYALSAFHAPNQMIIGSDKMACTVLVPQVLPQQAAITITRAGTVLTNLGQDATVRLNGVKVKEPMILQNGNHIEVGHSSFRYRERRRVVEGDPREVRVRPAAAAPEAVPPPVSAPPTPGSRIRLRSAGEPPPARGRIRVRPSRTRGADDDE